MVLNLSKFRESDEDEIETQSIYAENPTMFTMKVHYDGLFTKFPGRRYVKGKEKFVDLVDTDVFSVHELDDIMDTLGFNGKMYYHFMNPNSDLDIGLHALGSDQDVHHLSTYVQAGHRLIHVYIEHGKTSLNTYFTSPEGNNVVIEEVEEDDPSVPTKVVSSSCGRRLMLDWVDNDAPAPNVGRRLMLDLVDNDAPAPNVVKEVGQSSGSVKEPAVNTSTFVDDFYSASDPFLDLHDIDFVVDEPVVDNDNVVDEPVVGNDTAVDEPVVGNDNVVDEPVGDIEDCGDDSEDSEYLVDEANLINDVEVDMKEFHLYVDADVEFFGTGNNVDVANDEVVDVDVEVIDNEEFDSGSDEGDDIERTRKRKLKQLRKQNKSVDGVVYKTYFYVSQEFGTRDEVKNLIKRHSIETRRELKLVRLDNVRVRAICVGTIPTFEPSQSVGHSQPVGPSQTVGPSQSVGPSEHVKWTKSKIKYAASPTKPKGKKPKAGKDKENSCPWVLHVSKVKKSQTWMVKTYVPEHKCLQSRTVQACTAKFLSEELVDQIQSNPGVPIKAIQDQLQKKFNLSVSMMKAFRAKSVATNQVRGDFTQQYALLRDYVLELQNCNPMTTVRIAVENEPNPDQDTRVFKRIYICLGALKAGFKAGMREILGVDGAHMMGPFPGQLLTAVSLDPNNGIYPVAYGIVEAETKSSWTWFLECLRDDLELGPTSNFTFISDRQKGLIPAMAQVFPCAEHRYCLRHIHDNMKLKWRGKAFKDHLWKCATASTVPHFQKAMEDFKAYNREAYNWLASIPPQHWARSHFSGRAKSDVLLNNMCEVFNGKLLEGRDKPILGILEYAREYLMRKIVAVKQVIRNSHGPLTPTATRLLDEIKVKANDYRVIWNGGDKYQVSGPWLDQCVVDVVQRTCTCRRWDVTGIPCKHAVATNWNMALNNQPVDVVETWVHPCYRLDTWSHMYTFMVNPINGRIMWPKSLVPTTLLPPFHHTQSGRPKKKRIRSAGEAVEMVEHGKLTRKMKSVTCETCGNMGHNRRTCNGQTENIDNGKGKRKETEDGASGSNNQSKGKGKATEDDGNGSKKKKGKDGAGSRGKGIVIG